MAFWGVQVKPGKVTPFVPPPESSKLHLSQASLAASAPAGSKAALQVKVGDGEPLVLCVLREGGAESLGLDLIFDSYTEFSVEGKVAIHLTGYFMPEYELDDAHDIDDDEDDENEQRALMASPGQIIGFDDHGMPIMMGDYDSQDDSDYESEEEDEDDDLLMGSDDEDDSEDEESEEEEEMLSRGRKVVIEEIKDDEPIEKKGKKEAAAPASANGKARQFDDEDVLASDDEEEEEEGSEDDDEESEEEAPAPKQVAAGQKRKSEAAPAPAKKQAVEAQQGQRAAKPAPAAAAAKTPQQAQQQQKQQQQQPKSEKGAKQQQQQEGKTPAKTPGKDEGAPAANEVPSSNKKVRRFANGFEIEEVKMGRPDSKLAKPGKKVLVKYVGRLKSTGKVFDQTKGNSTFSFRLGVGEVIKGWDTGVNGMRVGDKRKLTIPPQMGYGTSGVRGAIPPNAWLVFDVELVDVKG